jgi:hypothetical protein
MSKANLTLTSLLFLLLTWPAMSNDLYNPVEFKIKPSTHEPINTSDYHKLSEDLKYRIHESPIPERSLASEKENDDSTWRNPSSIETTPPNVRLKQTETLEHWYYEE